jgi:hypothetical protein
MGMNCFPIIVFGEEYKTVLQNRNKNLRHAKKALKPYKIMHFVPQILDK